MRAPQFLLLSLLTVLLSAPCQVVAQGLLAKQFTSKYSKASIENYFTEIKEEFDTEISFSDLYLNPKEKRKAPARVATLGAFLYDLLEPFHVQIFERNHQIFIVPLTITASVSSPRATLNGYIKDEQSGEVIPGAMVFVKGENITAEANAQGFYSLTLNEGYYSFCIHALGYKGDTIDLYLKEPQRRDVLLESINLLPTIQITKERNRDIQPATAKTFQQQDIEQSVFPLGESDVFRRIQQEPGVITGLDGTTGIRVRGGDPGQNLNLLDGVPIYYIDHLYGASSVYNTDAIKTVDFYKGAFPAKYGGRLASIIDVTTKDGDMAKYKGQASLGLLKGTLNLEGPLVKNKSSFFLSARRTWADAVLPIFIDDFNLYFYDVNAKFNYIVNKNNRVYLSLYAGGDKIKEQRNSGSSSAFWGNKVGSVKWTSVLTPRLFLNTSVSLSSFNYELNDRRDVFDGGAIAQGSSYKGTSSINDKALRSGLEWRIRPNHSIESGIHVSKANFIPTRIETSIVGLPIESNQFEVLELGGYIQDKIVIKKTVDITAGLHFSNWSNKDFNYNSLQPRLAIVYSPYINQKLHANISYMTQFLHLISNNTYGLPTDFWIPSTASIKPENGLQGSLGFAGYKKGFNYSIEGYYKTMNGVTLYTTGKDIFDNSVRWQDRVIQGKGWGYGLETSLSKNWKAFTASSVYTLSWNWRQFDQLNQGAPFPHRYDRRHNFRASLHYQKTKKFGASIAWIYMSGEAFTMPDQIYPDFDRNLYINPSTELSSKEYTYSFTRWNNYRIPAIHHLDIGVFFWWRINKSLDHGLNLGIANAYGRPNVWYARLEHDAAANQLKLKGYSYTKFLPFLTYKINF